MKLPLSRTDLQNLKVNADKERLKNEIVQKFVSEITNDVIQQASSNNIRRQYCKNNWESVYLNEELQTLIRDKVLQNFAGCMVYFTNITFLTLVVDWS